MKVMCMCCSPLLLPFYHHTNTRAKTTLAIWKRSPIASPTFTRARHKKKKKKQKKSNTEPKEMAPPDHHIHGCTAAGTSQEPSISSRRWSPKFCHHYFEKRSWSLVTDFFSLVVAGHLSLDDLRFTERSAVVYVDSLHEGVPSAPNTHGNVLKVCFEKEKGGKWQRRTFRVLLSYDGESFVGWQRQPGLCTVQGVMEKALGKFVDGKRTRASVEDGKDPEANISVAGRTDKGVHAIGQVCSFYTWMQDVQAWEVEAAINAIHPHKLRALHVEEVSRTFHPNFSAKWRRYLYLLPLLDQEIKADAAGQKEVSVEEQKIDVARVNRMLQRLEGHSLSYAVFARDTQSSRSRGAATICTLFHARANIAELPSLDQNQTNRAHVLCIEVVADRFLRKMVRVLVSTAIREAATGASEDALLMMTDSSCRRDSAPPAPASGLCLAEVGYEDIEYSQFLVY